MSEELEPPISTLTLVDTPAPSSNVIYDEQSCTENNLIVKEYETDDNQQAEYSKNPPFVGTSVTELNEDGWHSEEWRNKGKHVFILSYAGKPIYCRYGSEEKLATLFGVMQALVSVFQDNNSEIYCISCEDSQFTFLSKEHLILVSVSRTTNEHVEESRQQLNCIYSQVISILTLSQLTRVFSQHRNFDLRRLLAGAERLIDGMIKFTEIQPSFFLNGVECLPLPSNTREQIVHAITSTCSKIKNLLFAILVSENQLICMVRMKKYDLQPPDFHVIFNFVNSSQSFRTGENWTPLCLPNFDSSGFLQVHVSYLAEDCPICLLLIAVDRDMFFSLSEAKSGIVEKLRKGDCVEEINKSLKHPKIMTSEWNIQGLRHFMYKEKTTNQILYPAYEPPYMTQKLQKELYQNYKDLYYRLNSTDCPLKLLYKQYEYEIFLASDTKEHQMFLVMEPFLTKQEATTTMEKLLKAIKKRRDTLFITSSPTF